MHRLRPGVFTLLAALSGLAGCGRGGDADTTPTETAGTDATTGTPTPGLFCVEHCADDSDCTIEGSALGYVCKHSRCEPGPCTSDAQCFALSTSWTEPCKSQADCRGEPCVDIGGGDGRCASAPSALFPCSATLADVEVLLPPIEGGAPVTVCAATERTCTVETGVCEARCSGDADCLYLYAPICDLDARRCGCATDADCQAHDRPDFGSCNAGSCGCSSDADCRQSVLGTHCGSTGRCGCASDTDCPDVDGRDTCYDGLCGCASATACTARFDGTNLACEGA